MGVERHRDRLAYTAADCLVPELQHCGWTRLRAASDAALPAHAHIGWEICWVRRGGVDWWAGGGDWHVAQGDCYVTHPGEPHGGAHTVLERCELFWLSIAPVAGSLPGMDAADARAPRPPRHAAAGFRRRGRRAQRPVVGAAVGAPRRAGLRAGPRARGAARRARDRHRCRRPPPAGARAVAADRRRARSRPRASRSRLLGRRARPRRAAVAEPLPRPLRRRGRRDPRRLDAAAAHRRRQAPPRRQRHADHRARARSRFPVEPVLRHGVPAVCRTDAARVPPPG